MWNPFRSLAAARARKRAGALIDARDFVGAVEPAAEAARLEPDHAPGWRMLAVALKHAGRWAACLDACDRAIALDPADADGMHWNAGIAATALGRWPRARAAWTAYGVELPAGDGPLAMRLGLTPIRVNPNGAAEVVWCDRIDPCRAIIRSVPLPESGRRHGDLVLHDGEPRGSRMYGDSKRSVFDELGLLEASGYGTWEVLASCATAEERDALVARFEALDGAIEDWTENVEMLCARCSLGEPHDHDHDHAPSSWQPQRRFGVAARDEAVIARLPVDAAATRLR